MVEAEWPSFPSSLLDAPAEDWGSLPAGGGSGLGPAEEDSVIHTPREEHEEGQEGLLAQLEEAFASDGGGHQDRAKALEIIQMFLSTRRVRLLEDLLLLSESLGESDGDGTATRTGAANTAAAAGGVAAATHRGGAGPLSSVAELRRELAIAVKAIDTSTTTATTDSYFGDSAVAGGGDGGGPLLLGEGGAAAEALRAAADVSTETFFEAWAERFGTIVVPLSAWAGGDTDGDGGGGGSSGDSGGRGAARKDDREIQAARDVERDTLSVNGVLMKGSEGYPVIVGKVKRELARLVEPVAGPDVVGGGGGTPPAQTVDFRGSAERPPVPSLPRGEREGLPLRPPRQLQDFSKLVLKAANRTESGGLSFDAINRIMELCPGACDGSVLVVPDSSKAEPLGINITAESFTQDGKSRFGPIERSEIPELQGGLHVFGICAHVEAVTVYSIYSADMERVHLKLRATFRNSLRLPVSPFSAAACRVFSDVGYRGERGQVQIEVVEGGHRSDLG